jgi:hypothetical protein
MSLIFGKQSSNEVTPVLVDSLGRLIVSASSPTFEQPIGQISYFTNLSLPAGVSNQTIATVPAGQRWIMNSVYLRYDGTVAGVSLYLGLNIGGTIYHIRRFTPVVSTDLNFHTCDIVLEAGTAIVGTVLGATLNDDFYGAVHSRRIQ